MKAIARHTLATWGKQQARKYMRALNRAMRELAMRPDLGRAFERLHQGLRVYPCGKHMIFYLATGNGIDVVRVLHQRMDALSHL